MNATTGMLAALIGLGLAALGFMAAEGAAEWYHWIHPDHVAATLPAPLKLKDSTVVGMPTTDNSNVAWTATTNTYASIVLTPADELTINAGDGSRLVAINLHTGHVKISKGKADAGAQEFWRAVTMAYPESCPPRTIETPSSWPDTHVNH